ncbi:MAG: metallophosphoesterase [Candidatus Nanopelagicales bacterium]
MRWFTSDQHFGHANIIRYCDRPFDSTDAMDAELIERYNSVVAPTDEVWWLGDVAMGNAQETLSNVAQCNGVKHLIVGNHDRVFARPHAKRQPSAKWDVIYRDVGFTSIIHAPMPMALSDGRGVLLCHFPYQGDSHDEDRFDASRPRDRGEWLLHGHVHEKWRQQGRQINVGVDAWGGLPVSEAQVCALIDGGAADSAPIAWN